MLPVRLNYKNKDAINDDIINSKFFLKNGELSQYALCCGYIQRAIIGEAISLSLWEEHGAFHVLGHDHETGARLVWETFSSVGEARKAFHKHKSILRRRRF